MATDQLREKSSLPHCSSYTKSYGYYVFLISSGRKKNRDYHARLDIQQRLRMKNTFVLYSLSGSSLSDNAKYKNPTVHAHASSHQRGTTHHSDSPLLERRVTVGEPRESLAQATPSFDLLPTQGSRALRFD